MRSRPVGPRVTGLVRRTSWLMLGAAIGLAAVVLTVSVAQLLTLVVPGPDWPLIVCSLAAIPLLGLLPGIRELETTAARSLLGVEEPLVLPDEPRPEHRLRTVGWVTVHLVTGLGVAVLIFAGLPGAVAVLVAAASGAPVELLGLALPTDRPGTGTAIGAAAVICFVVPLVATWATGLGVRRLAPWFLGPTWRDQWELAEARLAAETTHTRLARELHDGIGHALTIISVQATAARRAGEPQATERGLQLIEQTAHDALSDLDSVLGLLRDGEPVSRRPEPDLAELATLIDRHREAGMSIDLVTPTADDLSGLPGTVSRLAYRVVAEGLTNAERYAGAGSVRVVFRSGADLLLVEISSPPGRALPAGRRGHGLPALVDQVRLIGGRLDAGPDPGGWWRLIASLPHGRRRG